MVDINTEIESRLHCITLHNNDDDVRELKYIYKKVGHTLMTKFKRTIVGECRFKKVLEKKNTPGGPKDSNFFSLAMPDPSASK